MESGVNYNCYPSSRFNTSSNYNNPVEEESIRYPRRNQSNNWDRDPKGGFRREELPDVDHRELKKQPIPLPSRYRSTFNDVQSRGENPVVYPRTGYNQNPQHTSDGDWSHDKSFHGENQHNFQDIVRDRDQLRDHLHNRDEQWNPERSYANRDNFPDESHVRERTTDSLRDHGTNQWNPDRSFPRNDRNNFREKQLPPQQPAHARTYFNASNYNATGNLERSFHDKSGNNFSNKEQLQQQHPVQPQSFPPYNCNAAKNSYVDNSRQAHAVVSTQNSVPALNSKSGINSMNSSNLPVNPSSVAGIPGTVGSSVGIPGAAESSMGIPGTARSSIKPFTYPSPVVPVMAGTDVAKIAGSKINPSIVKDIQLPVAANINVTQATGPVINPCTFMTNIAKNNMAMELKGQACVRLICREIIKLTKSVLYPPKINSRWTAPPRAVRPPGCKTVNVRGLPVKATEEIIREVFEVCGVVEKIEPSRNNFFWLITYSLESCAEKAMRYSGYRIQVEDKDDFEYAGKISIDYDSKDSPQEFEREVAQRKLLREARHRKAKEPKGISPPRPPSVKHFSQVEASLIHKKLRAEDTFEQAVNILVTWFERGECTKWTASFFYSMIQSVNSHVRRLLSEKTKYEEEFNKANMTLKQQMQGILSQYNQITKVFDSVSLKKVWDTFTKIQRKNIEIWKKQTEEIKNAHIEEFLKDRIEDEMEVSDNEEEKDENTSQSTPDISNQEKDKYEEELNKLRKENDDLRIKLEAAENETIVLKSETAEKDRLIKALKHDLENSAEEVKKLSQKRSIDEAEIEEFRAFKSRSLDNNNQGGRSDYLECGADNWASMNVHASSSEDETYLITRVSMFLLVHQLGANADQICSYLKKTNPTIQPIDVENLMNRFSTVFEEVSNGNGPKKWICKNSNL